MRKVEAEVQVRVDAAAVIRAFVTAGQLAQWWGTDRALVEPRQGGVYTLTWAVSPSGFGYVTTGYIAEYDPQHRLVIDRMVYMNPERELLGPMRLIVTASAEEKGTQVTVCQDGYLSGGDWDWYYDAVCQAWPLVLQRLARFLELDMNPPG